MREDELSGATTTNIFVKLARSWASCELLFKIELAQARIWGCLLVTRLIKVTLKKVSPPLPHNNFFKFSWHTILKEPLRPSLFFNHLPRYVPGNITLVCSDGGSASPPLILNRYQQCRAANSISSTTGLMARNHLKIMCQGVIIPSWLGISSTTGTASWISWGLGGTQLFG